MASLNNITRKAGEHCLTDYIGINWCKATQPESGLYINSLPGISLKSIDATADDEQVTFLQVWNHVQSRAIRILNTAVINEFGKRYKLCRLSESFDLGKQVNLQTNQTNDPQSAKGIVISLGDPHSTLQFIHVQEVWVYLKSDTSYQVIFYDLDKEVQLQVMNLTGVKGWNRVPVNRDFFDIIKLGIVFLGVDENPELLLNENLAADCCTACWQQNGCAATVQGVLGNNNETIYGNNTYGLSAVFSIRCDYNQLLCNNKSLFATALWYLLGAELLTERLHSDRLNRYTTVDLKKASELREEFYKQYKLEMVAAVEGIDLNSTDCCLECNQPLTLQTNLP